MSRSGYSDEWDGDGVPPQFYQEAVIRAANGKRGQAFLRKLAAHMDAMPEKKLVAHDWVADDGAACALGVVLQAERPDLAEQSTNWDTDDDWGVRYIARQLDIANSLAAEIVYVNDEGGQWRHGDQPETPEQRWERVRRWVAGAIRP